MMMLKRPVSTRNLDLDDDDEANGWFDASPDLNELAQQEKLHFCDSKVQCDLMQNVEQTKIIEKLSLAPSSFDDEMKFSDQVVQTEIDDNQRFREKFEKMIADHGDLFSNNNKNPLDDIDVIISVLKKLQNDILTLER